MRSAVGALQLTCAACLLSIASSYTLSLPLTSLPHRRPAFVGQRLGALTFTADAHVQHGNCYSNAFTLTRMTGAREAISADIPPATLRHFYVLVKDPADKHLDPLEDPFRIQNVKADASFSLLYTDLNASVSEEGGPDTLLHRLAALPVAVEFAEEHRTFALPGKFTVRLRERTFGQSGVGGSLWSAGIGLSIWLAFHRDIQVTGKSVLELGSGVGLTGMTCAMAGGATTLSDFGLVSGTSATQVLLPAHSPTVTDRMGKGVPDKSALAGEGSATEEQERSNVASIATDEPQALDFEKQAVYEEGLRRRKQQAVIARAVMLKWRKELVLAAEGKAAADEQDDDEEDESEFNLPALGGGAAAAQRASERMSTTSEIHQPQELLQNLAYTLELNGLTHVCQLAHLDWHSTLHPSFVPDQQYDVVIGSDLIYYTTDAAALSATVVAHTAATGVAYLMCQRGRRGLDDLLRLLRVNGEVKEEEYTLVELVNTDAQPPPLVLVTFRPFDLQRK